VRTRLVACSAVLLLLVFSSALAQSPAVLQPTTANYSSQELEALRSGILQLERVLADRFLGSQKIFDPGGWGAAQFATFSAGSLSERGYDVRVAVGAGEPSGTHSWVLVGIPVGTRTAWVPVEAVPAGGQPQTILGRIAYGTGSGIVRPFDERYTQGYSARELAPNQPPVGKLRLDRQDYNLGDKARLLAMSSYDPDGVIVVYRYAINGEPFSARPSSSEVYTFRKAGAYTVSVTAVDAGGRSGTTSVTVVAVDPGLSEPPTGGSSGGCGCGG